MTPERAHFQRKTVWESLEFQVFSFQPEKMKTLISARCRVGNFSREISVERDSVLQFGFARAAGG
jgi:hypothetical protein